MGGKAKESGHKTHTVDAERTPLDDEQNDPAVEGRLHAYNVDAGKFGDRQMDKLTMESGRRTHNVDAK